MGPDRSEQCAALLRSFMELVADFEVPLAHEKSEGPSQVLTFLGVELDTVSQSSRLPQDKFDALLDLLAEFKVKWKVSLGELQ